MINGCTERITDQRQDEFSDASVFQESDGNAGQSGEQEGGGEDRFPAPVVHDEGAEHEGRDLNQGRQDG